MPEEKSTLAPCLIPARLFHAGGVDDVSLTRIGEDRTQFTAALPLQDGDPAVLELNRPTDGTRVRIPCTVASVRHEGGLWGAKPAVHVDFEASLEEAEALHPSEADTPPTIPERKAKPPAGRRPAALGGVGLGPRKRVAPRPRPAPEPEAQPEPEREPELELEPEPEPEGRHPQPEGDSQKAPEPPPEPQEARAEQPEAPDDPDLGRSPASPESQESPKAASRPEPEPETETETETEAETETEPEPEPEAPLSPLGTPIEDAPTDEVSSVPLGLTDEDEEATLDDEDDPPPPLGRPTDEDLPTATAKRQDGVYRLEDLLAPDRIGEITDSQRSPRSQPASGAGHAPWERSASKPGAVAAARTTPQPPEKKGFFAGLRKAFERPTRRPTAATPWRKDALQVSAEQVKREARILSEVEVFYQAAGDRHQGVAQDFSRQGMFLATGPSAPLPRIGAIVRVFFPVELPSEVVQCRLNAEVRWVHGEDDERADGRGAGLQITAFDTRAEREVFEAYVAALLEE